MDPPYDIPQGNLQRLLEYLELRADLQIDGSVQDWSHYLIRTGRAQVIQDIRQLLKEIEERNVLR